MMFVTIADATGIIEGVIFPNTYKLLKDDIEVDVPLIIKGTVNERNDSKSMIVDFIQKIDVDKARKYKVTAKEGAEVKEKESKYSAKTKEEQIPEVPSEIEIRIPRGTTKAKLKDVRQVLIDNPGDIPICIFIPNGGDVPKKIKLAKGVEWNDEIKKMVKEFK